jgi:hypothetical protein
MRLTYANVVSSLALVLSVSTGGAYAAGNITGEDTRRTSPSRTGVQPQLAASDPPIVFRPYAYGTQGFTTRPLLEFFVGEFSRAGAMGVRAAIPNGNPKAGAMLYTRDYDDRYSLALDYRVGARPRIISESRRPLRVQTGAGGPIVLDPGGFVPERDDGTAPARRAGPGAVSVRGYVVLQGLRALPRSAPTGSLAQVNDRLYWRSGRRGWVAIG